MTHSDLNPAVVLDAFAAVIDGEDSEAVNALLADVATRDLLTIESMAIRLIWRCRDERQRRDPKNG